MYSFYSLSPSLFALRSYVTLHSLQYIVLGFFVLRSVVGSIIFVLSFYILHNGSSFFGWFVVVAAIYRKLRLNALFFFRSMFYMKNKTLKKHQTRIMHKQDRHFT